MTKSTLLHDATPEELIEKISQKLQEQFNNLKTEIANSDLNAELMTPKEVCEFLQIDASTLWMWSKSGKINKYGLGKRRYFKRSEIMQSLILLERG